MSSSLKDFDFSVRPAFVTSMPVRFNDVNFANHLDYAALLEIIGNARSLFLNEHNTNELDIEGVGLITKSLNVEYISEAKFNDLLEVSVFVGDIRGVRANLYFSVKNLTNKTETARVCVGIVFYDYEKKKPAPVPEKFIKIANMAV